jgi:O-antigen/teichoic acid export membrane protein
LTGLAGRLGRNVAWLAAGEVAVKGGLLLAGAIVARGLGPAAMGTFTVGYGAALVLMIVLAGGQFDVVVREVARRPGAARPLGVLATSWQRRVALAAVPVALVLLLLVSSPPLRATLAAFVPYALLRCRLVTIGSVFKGLDRMEVEVAGRAVEIGVALAGLLLAARLGGPIWSSGVAFSVGAVAGLATVATRLRRLAAGQPAQRDRAWMAREGAAFLGLGLATQLLTRLDAFALAAAGVADESIGLYGVAAAPLWGLYAAPLLVSAALYPTLSRLAGERGLTVRRVVALGATGVALGGLLGGLLFALRRWIIALVFGPGYEGAVPLLGVLAAALPGASAALLLAAAVAAAGRQRWTLAWQLCVVGAAGAGYLAVVPRFGLPGCATVTTLVHSVAALGMFAVAVAAARRPALAAGPTPSAD